MWVAGQKVWDGETMYYIPFILNKNNIIISTQTAFNSQSWTDIVLSDTNFNHGTYISPSDVHQSSSSNVLDSVLYISTNDRTYANHPHLYLYTDDDWEFSSHCSAITESGKTSLVSAVTEIIGVDTGGAVDPGAYYLITSGGSLTLKNYSASEQFTISWQVYCQTGETHSLVILDEGHNTVGPGSITNVPWGNGQTGFVEIPSTSEGESLEIGYTISGLPSEFENPYSRSFTMQIHGQEDGYVYVNLPALSLPPISSLS